MASLYLLVLILGTLGLVLGQFPSEDRVTLLIIGTFYMLLGGVLFVGFAAVFLFKPSPFSWVYSLVLICIGFGGCPTIAASIPLLIYWIKPDTRSYYGKA